MATAVKTGWLQDNNGDKFAPKTLVSQVQTSDGILLEDKIQTDLNGIKEYVNVRVPNWSTSDEGKILRVVNSAPAWASIPVAEEATFGG